MLFVNCGSCQHFIKDTIGSGQGIGKCQVLEDYKLKIKDKPMQEQKRLLQLAEVKLGIVPLKAKEPVRLMYPKVIRVCEKFVTLMV